MHEKGPPDKYEKNGACIVRIEFTPVVEIGVNREHYFPQETTNEGSTLSKAWACYNLYCF